MNLDIFVGVLRGKNKNKPMCYKKKTKVRPIIITRWRYRFNPAFSDLSQEPHSGQTMQFHKEYIYKMFL